MLKKILENIKKVVNNKTEGNSKKKIENLVVFLIILIITVVAINVIWKEDKKANTNEHIITNNKELAILENDLNVINQADEGKEEGLEKRLETILSNINGVRRS